MAQYVLFYIYVLYNQSYIKGNFFLVYIVSTKELEYHSKFLICENVKL